MNSDIIAIDIHNADEIGVEGLYDEFCARGYTLSDGYTPEYASVIDEFYMFCYEDEDGYPVIAFTTEDSGKAARFLEEVEPLDFERALSRYGYGN